MDHQMPVVTEPSAGHHHHHQDASALASGDPFLLMPPIWPLLFGEPGPHPSVVHLTTDAPPLAFRPLAEYRVLCGFTPRADLAEMVTYVVGDGVGAVLGAPELDSAAFTRCTACRTAHGELVDRAIATASGTMSA